MKLFALLTALIFTTGVFAQSWQDVGGGTNNSSHGMVVYNNKLINLGSYNNPCNRVAEWDGTNWQCLGGGVGIVARAACVWDGKLVVVGDFWNNFQPCNGCNGVAVWDGSTWTNLDQGFNNDVLTCTVHNGDLYIGGDFTATGGGTPIARVARWDSAAGIFQSMGGVLDLDNDVRCMTSFQGELWVGGDFNNVAGNSPSDGVVKWDTSLNGGAGGWAGGNSGVDLVGGVNETVRVLYVNPNDGNLYMGGHFPELIDGNAGVVDYNMSGIAMYDGSVWTPLGSGLNDYCRAIHEYNGNLVAGGYFTTAGGVAAQRIATWNGTTWTPMGLGFNGVGIDEYVKSAMSWNGIFFAGGAYTIAESNPMNYIAQWYQVPSNPPTAAIGSFNQNICSGTCVNFTDNSTSTPTSWAWSFPGASTTSSTSQNPSNICYPSGGTYTVQLIACNANGCDTTTSTITVTNAPTVSVNNATICSGSNATLTATPSTGGGTYVWSPGGQTTSSITVNPSSTTSYTVQYTLNGCSSSTQTSTVTVNPTPSLSVNNTTICNGDPATLTATPSQAGGSYSWNPGGSTNSSITVSPTSTTNYTVTYTLNGCASTPQTGTVTVNPTYSLTENASACNGSPYTFPDGVTQTITATTSHTSNLTTTNGCDSIIVTSVTVNPTYSLTENFNVCTGTSYTYPDGTLSTNITANESHTSSLSTTNGCDSIITTNLTVVTAINTTQNTSVCQGSNYTYPDGTVSTNIQVNESHLSQLTATSGCDSNITTNLTVNPVYNGNESITACAGTTVTYPDGSSEVVSVNTSHTSNLTTVAGCDSIIVSTVTVNPSYSSNEDVTLCEGEDYTYPDGLTVTNLTANESHTSNLSTTNGCDSTITTNLIVNPLPDNTTSELNNVITATQGGAQYQWVDCNNNFAILSGETNQSFTPTANGNYAVIVSVNGCSDTSACTIISTIGIIELQGESITLYPNPVVDELNIESSNLEEINYQIFDVQGKLILNGRLPESNKIELTTLSSGAYTIVLNELVRLKFVKE